MNIVHGNINKYYILIREILNHLLLSILEVWKYVHFYFFGFSNLINVDTILLLNCCSWNNNLK